MAGATHLLAASNNSNPSTSVSGTSAAATTAGDKVLVTLMVPNSNPTALTVTFDGQAMTEMASARSTRSNKTILTFYYDDAAGRASGKTISAAWTNTGTQNGGGSLLLASKATPTNAFVAGAADKINPNQGLSSAPSTGASGTPSDTTAKYFAYAVLGVIFNSTGLESADNSYTAMTQAANTTRNLLLDAAWKEFTSPPVATQTETWTQTWGGNKDWVAAILMFKESVPSAPTISVAPAMTGTETVGSTLTCGTGTWTGSPTGYAYQWYRDVGTSGSTWLAISGATASTYVLTVDDIGSKVRCGVIASNVNGNSAESASNATTVTIPAPSGISVRIVAGPVGQSDNQVHTTPFSKPVLAGEDILVFVCCSNANTTDGNGNKSDAGTIADPDGDTYTERAEAFSDTSIQHSAQIFHAVASVKKDYGDNLTMTVHGGTGAGGYHGQSPIWFAVAVNSGNGAGFSFDQQAHQVDLLTTHVAPNITSTGTDAVVFGLHAGEPGAGGGWWTPATGFTELVDTPAANSGGAFTGESGYNVAAEYKVVSAPYTGGAGGATGSNKTITNVVLSLKRLGGSPVEVQSVPASVSMSALSGVGLAVTAPGAGLFTASGLAGVAEQVQSPAALVTASGQASTALSVSAGATFTAGGGSNSLLMVVVAPPGHVQFSGLADVIADNTVRVYAVPASASMSAQASVSWALTAPPGSLTAQGVAQVAWELRGGSTVTVSAQAVVVNSVGAGATASFASTTLGIIETLTSPPASVSFNIPPITVTSGIVVQAVPGSVSMPSTSATLPAVFSGVVATIHFPATVVSVHFPSTISRFPAQVLSIGDDTPKLTSVEGF